MLQSAQAQSQDCQKQFAADESRASDLQTLLRDKDAKLDRHDAELAQALDTLQEKEFALLSSSLQRSEAESEAFRRDFNDVAALREQI